jgi:hypothetical protein
MHTIFGGLKLASIWVAGMGAGFLADTTLPIVTPDTHVPLGAAVSAAIACLGAAFWLSRQLTKLQDGQKSLTEGQARLEEGFSRLPCDQWPRSAPECPADPKASPEPSRIIKK